jgi:hypothetical protein
MRRSKTFKSNYTFMKGVNYIFLSLDRELSGEECEELAKKYFQSHHQPLTLPEQTLLVDLRPAFEQPLDTVTPDIHRLA